MIFGNILIISDSYILTIYIIYTYLLIELNILFEKYFTLFFKFLIVTTDVPDVFLSILSKLYFLTQDTYFSNNFLSILSQFLG
jgi:hypothetical protein